MMTFMILLALVILGTVNWFIMNAMLAEHEGVEAELDHSIEMYKNYIAYLKARRQ